MQERLDLAKGISIIAFDPGVTTGVFRLNKNGSWSVKEIMHDDLIKILAWGRSDSRLKADVWVIERFSLYANKAASKTRSTFPECEVIGLLKALAIRLEIETVVLQNASEAKGLVDNERLKAYGWKLPTTHIKDAARHAVYFLAKRQQQIEKDADHAKKRADKAGLPSRAGR